ncbi:MAG TPA: recombinase family protein [Planctomycetaceae bacterium]|nr:recombinase family protein [Planctomycetaceae bacterium]
MIDVLPIESEKPLRYALYARQSVEPSQGEPSTELPLERQMVALRTAMRRQHPQGREVAAYQDRGLGFPAERGLAQLLGDLDSGRILVDWLVVEDLARLARTVVERQRCRQLLADRHVTIVTITGT